MWNKRDEELGRPMAPQQPGAAPLPPVPPPPVASDRYDAAAIGSSIKIVGDVTGDEDLTILGKIEGKIVPGAPVTIGQSAASRPTSRRSS
jgi:hypothetical protein